MCLHTNELREIQQRTDYEYRLDLLRQAHRLIAEADGETGQLERCLHAVARAIRLTGGQLKGLER